MMNEQKSGWASHIEQLIREREGFEHDDIPMSTYVEPQGFPWVYVLICLAIFGAGIFLGYGLVWDIGEPGWAWSLCR